MENEDPPDEKVADAPDKADTAERQVAVRLAKRFQRNFFWAVFLLNLLAILWGLSDLKWKAWAVAYSFGPWLNAHLACLGLAALPFLYRRARGYSPLAHIFFVALLAIAGAGFDFVAIGIGVMLLAN